jgi:hypothetical protein
MINHSILKKKHCKSICEMIRFDFNSTVNFEKCIWAT